MLAAFSEMANVKACEWIRGSKSEGDNPVQFVFVVPLVDPVCAEVVSEQWQRTVCLEAFNQVE